MFIKSLVSLMLFLVLSSCNNSYKFTLNSPKKIQINQELSFSLKEKNNKPFDSVLFFIDEQKIESNGNSATLNIEKYKLGKHTISALVFFQNKSEKITSVIYFMATTAPEIYTYKVINTYPHDSKAYTQGLEFYNGFLYEGTGRKGSSSIRKVELKTGKVLQQLELDKQYFGEGITIFNNQLYQLTWESGIGFIYDVDTFEKLSEFKYEHSLEGWGLTHNNEKLIKTDGTERIWFLNPETLKEENYIEAYTNTQKVEKLNEIEFINGKIYANRWQLNSILIINPENGKVEGVADLNGLKDLLAQSQKVEDSDEVLNGIAYDKENNRLFVTGKHWSKLYEIELIKK